MIAELSPPRCLLTLVSLSMVLSGIAQPEPPLWMLDALGIHADSLSRPGASWAKYFPADQEPPFINQFIGTWTLKVRSPAYPALSGEYRCWSDTTQAILQATDISGRSVYMVDLRARTAVWAQSVDGKPTAVIRSFAVTKPYKDELISVPGAFLATNQERSILGHRCIAHQMVLSDEPTHFWLAPIAPSPFNDLVEWLPGVGSFASAHELAVPFDGTVLMKDAGLLITEVSELVLGPQPRPVIDLRDHNVEDDRFWISRKRPPIAPRSPPLPNPLLTPGRDPLDDLPGLATDSLGHSLPEWLSVKCPRRWVRRVPGKRPPGKRGTKVVVLCIVRPDGFIDTSALCIVNGSEQEGGIKEPPYSAQEKRALDLIGAIAFSPIPPEGDQIPYVATITIKY